MKNKFETALKITEIVVGFAGAILGAVATIKASKIKEKDVEDISARTAEKVLSKLKIEEE